MGHDLLFASVLSYLSPDGVTSVGSSARYLFCLCSFCFVVLMISMLIVVIGTLSVEKVGEGRGE